ncbi:hypothetical protein A4S06_06065 [Erysipelotrichaceae bacterium MTC7]|nr:hypothetical protein A4S06_06065 [Erysipelotrichaceae bacterium MTC7]
MKKLLALCIVVVLAGCSTSGRDAILSSEEKHTLEDYGVLDYVKNDCKNIRTVQKMLHEDFKKEHVKAYCGLNVSKTEFINPLLDLGFSTKQVKALVALDYLDAKRLERYDAYAQKNPEVSMEDVVLAVNLDQDETAYENITLVEDESLDVLINKHYGLPEGYVPSDLVEIQSVCLQGSDYSCSTMDKQQLRKAAVADYEAFVAYVKEKKNYDIVSIASYRSYDYQKNLYAYWKGENGEAYADTYYARPGHSEHNGGLAIDISVRGFPFNELDTFEDYEYLVETFKDYGFVLRYPEDKVDVTGYGAEAWHFRYVGKELAQKLYTSGMTLDEYHALEAR